MISLINNEFIKLGKIKLITPFVIFSSVGLLEKFIFKTIQINRLFNLIPFIGIILCVMFSGIISNEIEFGTFRLYLTKAKSRIKIYNAKIITIFIYNFCLTSYVLCLYLLLCKHFDLDFILKYFIYTIPLYFISSLTILFSIIINTPINAGICIFLNSFSGLISEILFKNNIKFIQYTFLPYLDFSIFLNKSSIRSINLDYGTNLNLYYGIFINILFTILFIILGCYFFKKKDIKS